MLGSFQISRHPWDCITEGYKLLETRLFNDGADWSKKLTQIANAEKGHSGEVIPVIAVSVPLVLSPYIKLVRWLLLISDIT